MRKFIVLSTLCATLLLAGERIEIVGTQVDANGSLVSATDHPILLYQDQIVSAQTMTYDHNSSIVEAFGNVNAFKAGQYHAISEYAKLNLDEDTRYSKPYYSFDTDSRVWMNAAEASGCQTKIDLTSGMVSGCDSADPLWKIHFSSADYDTENMWVNMYNARLYIEDIPVMYLPYFGYPTDRTRRSGLLIPTFGISSTEGFSYKQPIYWAPTNWFDAEFRPEIRTQRGAGMYTDLRFVDSPTSKGAIQVGYFKEQSDYVQEYELAHDKHYGFKANYTHPDVLHDWFGLEAEGESGLYVNGMWMNDVDYLNLQASDVTHNVTSNQILSRINGYYSSEDNYMGAYFRHYQDLSLNSNSETLQTLPNLQYHRYLENFFGDHLLVNGDIQASNFYRPDGMNAVQTDMNVPVTLQTSLFDEYLDLSYTANAVAQTIGFYGNPLEGESKDSYSSGYNAQLDHTFSVGSTLVRSYDDMTHVMAPNVSYTIAGKRLYNGYYDDYHGKCDSTSADYAGSACQFYTLQEPMDSLALGVNNFLFEGGKQWLVDRLSQTFTYDDVGSYYGELRNELEWQITQAISYYNQTSFNHDRNRVTKEQNTIRYNDGVVIGGIGHYYTDQLKNNDILQTSTTEYSSYWNADIAYQYNHYYKVFGLVAYDYRESLLKRGEIGFLYTQRCWDFGLKYVKNRNPILTDTGTNNTRDNSYIFITVILKPLGGSDFDYQLTQN